MRSLATLLTGSLLALSLAGCGVFSPTPVLSASAAAGGQDAAAAQLAAEAVQTDPSLNGLPTQVVPVPRAPVVPRPPSTTGNSARLFVSPAETLPALKALISSAQKSIYFETFNFGNDSYGRQIVPLLVAKAQSGVEVKVNIDFIGSRFLPGYGDMVNQLRAGGVQVLVYQTRMLRQVDGVLSVNITHRKEYLADGTRALVGGVNLMAPFDTTTEDVLVEWQGPIVPQLYSEYAHDWVAAGGAVSDLHQTPIALPHAGNVEAQIAVTDPPAGRFEARDAIFKEIDAAKRNIEIQQQYLWDDALVAHLTAALKRGVQVRVLIPNTEQKSLIRFVNDDAAETLVKAGAQVRFYLGITPTAHLHTKYFSIDDAWAIDGSCNGDTRSLISNQELDVSTTDPGLISQLKTQLFERDWAQHSEPFVYHPAGSVFGRIFRNLLDVFNYYM